MEEAERVVLEVALDPVDAQAMCERCVDVERLLRDLDLSLGREVPEGAHVVGTVGELDQDDAQVARHGEQHLPEVLGLLLLARAEVDLADLGDAVHQRRDLGTEGLLDLLQGSERVLDGVVQEPRRNARHVEPEVGDDAGHLERVREVGLAGEATLPVVLLGGEVVGLLDQVDRRGGVVGPHPVDQLADGHRVRRACSTISAARSAGERPSLCSTRS